MKHFTIHSIAIVVTLVFAGCMAVTAQPLTGGYDDSTEYFDSKKHNKWHNSPDFRKALAILNDVEEYEDINYEEAITLLEREIKQHPANGYAMCNAAKASINDDAVKMSMLIVELLYRNSGLSMDEVEAVFQKRREETRQVALEAVDLFRKGVALMPAADNENRCKAFITLGDLQHDEIGDNDASLAAYEQAAKILPCYQSYEKIMKFHMEQGDADKAIYYASKLGNMIDSDNEALRLMAQVYIDKKDYDTATTLINKAIANDDTDENAYQLLINVLTAQDRYQEALDKTIEMKELLSGQDLFDNLNSIYSLSDDNKAMVLNKLHQFEAKAENNSNKEAETTEWNYFEGLLLYFDKDYRSALTCFDKVLEHDASAPLLSLKSDCCYFLGDAPQALKLLNFALRMNEKNSIQEQLLREKIRIEMMSGMTNDYIYDSKVYSKAFPTYSMGFEALARGYCNKGQYAKALEACDEWSEQFENEIEARYFHAYVLKMWGKDDQAHEEMHDIVNDESCTSERKIFALYYMGETAQSRTLLEEMARVSELSASATADDNDLQREAMSFYNLACAYSLHGNTDRALHFLERHFAEEENATDFDYAILDDELNNVRKLPQFMEIINRYKQQWLNGELNKKK